jgi:hypothetical protein
MLCEWVNNTVITVTEYVLIWFEVLGGCEEGKTLSTFLQKIN